MSRIKTHKDLDVWKESRTLAELETQLLLSQELGFLKNEELNRSVERIRKMLSGLSKDFPVEVNLNLAKSLKRV